jgi:hypothetical protein
VAFKLVVIDDLDPPLLLDCYIEPGTDHVARVLGQRDDRQKSGSTTSVDYGQDGSILFPAIGPS